MSEQPDNAKLIAVADKQEVVLDEETIVGRSPSCGLAIDYKGLSRQHAKLTWRDEVLVLEDLKSTNGSFVNDRKITEPTPLKSGDIIGFENIQYTVVLPTKASDEAEEEDLEAKTQVAQLPEGWWAVNNDDDDGMTKAISLEDIQQQAPSTSVKLKEALENLGNKPCLVCTSGKYTSKIFRFNPSKETNTWEIGKNAECDVHLDEESLSGNHAQLINEGKRWKLVDVMSTNGTFINGQKTLTSYLASGDSIRLGEIQFKFHSGQVEETTDAKNDDAGATSNNKVMVISAAVFVVTLAVLLGAYFLLT